jgi:hypothetical protein
LAKFETSERYLGLIPDLGCKSEVAILVTTNASLGVDISVKNDSANAYTIYIVLEDLMPMSNLPTHVFGIISK